MVSDPRSNPRDAEFWGPQGLFVNAGCGIAAFAVILAAAVAASYRVLKWGGVLSE